MLTTEERRAIVKFRVEKRIRALARQRLLPHSDFGA